MGASKAAAVAKGQSQSHPSMHPSSSSSSHNGNNTSGGNKAGAAMMSVPMVSTARSCPKRKRKTIQRKRQEQQARLESLTTHQRDLQEMVRLAAEEVSVARRTLYNVLKTARQGSGGGVTPAPGQSQSSSPLESQSPHPLAFLDMGGSSSSHHHHHHHHHDM